MYTAIRLQRFTLVLRTLIPHTKNTPYRLLQHPIRITNLHRRLAIQIDKTKIQAMCHLITKQRHRRRVQRVRRTTQHTFVTSTHHRIRKASRQGTLKDHHRQRLRVKHTAVVSTTNLLQHQRQFAHSQYKARRTRTVHRTTTRAMRTRRRRQSHNRRGSRHSHATTAMRHPSLQTSSTLTQLLPQAKSQLANKLDKRTIRSASNALSGLTSEKIFKSGPPLSTDFRDTLVKMATVGRPKTYQPNRHHQKEQYVYQTKHSPTAKVPNIHKQKLTRHTTHQK